MARLKSFDMPSSFDAPPDAPPRRPAGPGRRQAAVYSILATALFMLLLGLVNAIVWRFPLRVRLGSDASGRLSERTRDVVVNLAEPLEIDCVMTADHALFDAVRLCLADLREAARSADGAPIEVRFIDPRRDLRRVEALKPDLDGAREAILLRSGTRMRRLLPDELVEKRLVFSGTEEWEAFRGDAVLGAAIRSLARAEPARLYVLGGQGEREIDDYHVRDGYSDLARSLRRHDYGMASLNLAVAGDVPRDAAAVLILGPRARFTDPSRQALHRYLGAGGRVLALLDAGIETGLDPLLAAWGVRLLPAIARGETLTGEELVVHRYADHAITRSLRNTVTVFSQPAVLDLSDSVDPAAPDRPTVIPLAGIGTEGWIEPLPSERDVRHRDRERVGGPAPVAVAVERGASSADLRVRPTRMVVIGDSGFGANGILQAGATGNRDFLLNAVAWLTETDAPSGASAAEPVLLVVLPDRGWSRLWLEIGVVWPVALAVLGVAVVGMRRRSRRP